MDALRIRVLGRVPYAEARDLQQALLESGHDYVELLEHPAVITLGRNADLEHIIGDPSSIGAEVISADRGGDVTLHGPGQLVAYAQISIEDDPKAIVAHVGHLEDAVIEVVAALLDANAVGGIGRLEGYPGVWVGTETEAPKKVCAIGVRTERHEGIRRTLHGIALNVDIDLGLFDVIVPCGIAEHGVTSLAAQGAEVSMSKVTHLLADALHRTLAPVRPVDLVSIERAGDLELKDLGAESMRLRRLRSSGVAPEAGLEISRRKPEWLRLEANFGTEYRSTRGLVKDLGLVTVCEEAGCPNISECWADGTATFMVNGERCTRACGFCLVDTRKPLALDPSEPARVAEAVERLGLSHAVVTCVARDDLADGGAGAIAETIRAIRVRTPSTAVEVLISDLKGSKADLELIIDAAPEVMNHNLETVARLQRAVRPSAGYARSLTVLARSAAAGLTTKSGLMVGLGESDEEILEAMEDLASVGVSIVTIGQYLRPTKDHLPVARWVEPAQFESYAEAGRSMGFAHVQSSPLTRSSYHAREASEAARPVAVTLGSTPSR